MRRFGTTIALVACVCLAACVEEKSELTIHADGSGAFQIVLDIAPQAAKALDEMAASPGNHLSMPWPMTPDNLSAMVQKAGMLLRKVDIGRQRDGSCHLDASITFEDINKLTSLPGLHLITPSFAKDDKGNIVISMASPLAILSAGSIEEGSSAEASKELFAKVKSTATGARLNMRVTLPGTILETNGRKVGSNSVEWQIEVDKLTYEDAQKDMRAVIPGGSVKVELPAGGKPARAQAAEPPQPKPAPSEFKVSVASVKTELELTQANGHREGKVTLTLAVQTPPGMELVECQEADLEQAVTNDGQGLSIQARDVYVRRSSREQADSYEIVLPMRGLQRPAASLASVKGELIMVAGGGAKSVRFSPLKDWVGKTLESPDLKGLEIRLESVSNDSVELWVTDRARTALKEVRFEHANGARADGTVGSSEGSATGWTCIYNVKVEPEGAMVLQVYQDQKKVTIPIDLKNVPLP